MQFQIVGIYIISNLKKQKNCEGFTLIELLVVIIFVVALSFVAIPNFVIQTGKARETEAKNYLSSAGRAQQAYFFEHGNFADTLTELDISFQENYYDFQSPSLVGINAVKHQAISKSQNPAETSTRNYSLGVYYDNSGRFLSILCQGLIPGEEAEAPDDISTGYSCNNGIPIQ